MGRSIYKVLKKAGPLLQALALHALSSLTFIILIYRKKQIGLPPVIFESAPDNLYKCISVSIYSMWGQNTAYEMEPNFSNNAEKIWSNLLGYS